jgi:hypothetical protein
MLFSKGSLLFQMRLLIVLKCRLGSGVFIGLKWLLACSTNGYGTRESALLVSVFFRPCGLSLVRLAELCYSCWSGFFLLFLASKGGFWLCPYCSLFLWGWLFGCVLGFLCTLFVFSFCASGTSCTCGVLLINLLIQKKKFKSCFLS